MFLHEVNNYAGNLLPFALNRTYFMPPANPFYIVTYDFSNPTNTNFTIDLLDYIVSEMNGNTLAGTIQSDHSIGVSFLNGSKVEIGGLINGGFSLDLLSSWSVGNGTGSSSVLSQFTSLNGNLNG